MTLPGGLLPQSHSLPSPPLPKGWFRLSDPSYSSGPQQGRPLAPGLARLGLPGGRGS